MREGDKKIGNFLNSKYYLVRGIGIIIFFFCGRLIMGWDLLILLYFLIYGVGMILGLVEGYRIYVWFNKCYGFYKIE